MKLTNLLLGGMLLSGVAVFAGEKEKLAEELLELNGTKKSIERMPEDINKMNTSMLKRRLAGVDIPQDGLAELQKQVLAKATDAFVWNKMKGDYIEVYADTYTEEELKAIVAFMKSPAGIKMREKNLELNKKNQKFIQDKMRSTMPEIVEISKAFAEKVKPLNKPEVKVAPIPAPVKK